jgi:hypothetical protein
MSNSVFSIEYYRVPYNGDISIRSHFTFRDGRRVLVDRRVTWYRDPAALEEDRFGKVNHRVSKVNLLRAIYRAGYSVIGMSKRRLEAESTRYVHDFDMRPKQTCTWS